MAYTNGYDHFFQEITADIDRCKTSGKRIVCGYTSNLDVLIEWNEKTFNHIISTFLENEPSLKAGDAIHSLGDFARIACYYAMHGLGGEIDITERSVCDYLLSQFKSCFALGGTAVQGATALSTLGFPVIVHPSDRSLEVCKIMNHPGVEVVAEQGLIPIEEACSGELPVLHIILQFPKGAKLIIKDKLYEIPVSNRLILDYDTKHKQIVVDQCFRDYCESNAKNLYCYSISGFNAITDIHNLMKEMDMLEAHYKKIKDANPNCIIYLEGAHFYNTDVQDLLFDRLSRIVDILGMNEEELVGHAERFGIDTDEKNLESVMRSLQFLTEKYPVKGIVLHTKDYSMYYGSEIDNANIVKGLTLGNLLSGTRARTARYGNMDDCRETIPLPLSATGLTFAEELEKMQPDHYVRLVPSKYIEDPACTIGLGDTFMAGVLIAFVR